MPHAARKRSLADDYPPASMHRPGRTRHLRERLATLRTTASDEIATVHPTAIVAPGSRLTERTTIGRGTKINGPLTVRGPATVAFGAYCAIGSGVKALTINHDVDRVNVQFELARQIGAPVRKVGKPVIVGDAAWLGDDVLLLPGAVVGTGAVVGAGAIVTGEIGPFELAVGVPARAIDRRCSPEVAALLMEVRWWDWPDDRLSRNVAFLDAHIAHVDPEELRALIRP